MQENGEDEKRKSLMDGDNRRSLQEKSLFISSSSSRFLSLQNSSCSR